MESEKKKKKVVNRSSALKFIAVAFLVGFVLGGLANERKLSNFAEKKQNFADELAVCEEIGGVASSMSTEIINLEMNNESMQKFYNYFGVAREYFVCVQKAYGFMEVEE